MEKPETYGDLPLVLDMNDLQKVLRLSKTSCFRLIHTKGFPAKQVTEGGAVRIGRDALFKWLETTDYETVDT